MNNFLLIHTSLDTGFAALTRDDQIMGCMENEEPREHGTFLHRAIQLLFEENNIKANDLDAIGVTGGPGSYTGIRVGVSAAKGIAFAADKPVVVCSNLGVMARQVIEEVKDRELIYIPVIHARKEEFYAGYYRSDLLEMKPNEVAGLRSIANEFSGKKILFFGIGIEESNTGLAGRVYDKQITHLTPAAMNYVVKSGFTNGMAVSAADAAPIYLKEAYITKNHKLHI